MATTSKTQGLPIWGWVVVLLAAVWLFGKTSGKSKHGGIL